MIHYILQTIVFQLLFLLAYDVLFKKETFFRWNRVYLLATAILSFALPIIKINGFKNTLPKNYIMELPEVVLGTLSIPQNNSIRLNTVVLKQNNTSNWEFIFFIGLCVAFCLFIYKIFKIYSLAKKNPRQTRGKIVLVELLNSSAAFSFFNYIFLGAGIKAEDKDAILQHELIHVQQKHSFDLLFFEVLRIVFWFNPFIYIYQSRMAILHEFIADSHAVKHHNKAQYYQNLLAQVFKTQNISFINTFFKQSLIKKRIVMLSKSKSKQVHLLKFVVLVPLVFGMLIYTSAQAKEKTNENRLVPLEIENLFDKQFEEKLPMVYKQTKLTDDTKGNRKAKPALMAKDDAFSKLVIVEEEKTTTNLKEKKQTATSKQDYNTIEVPFAIVEEVPVFPGCENLTKEEQRTCFSENISKHVSENYNVDLAEKLDLKGRQRINVIFKVNKEGNIVEIRSRSKHPALESEANRVIKSLPKMIAGRHKGKQVTVAYSLPIVFEIKEEAKKKETELVTINGVEVPFAVVEETPIFPGCENLTRDAQKNCFSEKIAKHVNENFNTGLAKKLGLSGRQRIHGIFKIDTGGYITGVRARAAQPELEAEAERVIKSLPKMIPGKQRGKKVIVPYYLPIVFEVNE